MVLTNYFGDWIQESGKIKMKIISDKGYTTEYNFFSIKELINPKYSTWELIKIILLKYNEVSAGSDIASKQSNHYDNLLWYIR